MEGCVEPDNDAPLAMGDTTKEEIPEEDQDKADEFRSQAAKAYSQQKYDEAISLYTQAIELNPLSAPFFTKRAQSLIKQSKPNACVRDCNRALEINVDSAAAYKFRGKANRLLGKWEEAAKDLRQACKLDFDEEADEWLREVTPNAKKLEQYKLKKEKSIPKVNKPQPSSSAPPSFGGGGGSKIPSFSTDNMFSSFGDIMGDFNDPEIMNAFLDVTKNPANMHKYKNNPKFMKLFDVLEKATAGANIPSGADIPTAPGTTGRHF